MILRKVERQVLLAKPFEAEMTALLANVDLAAGDVDCRTEFLAVGTPLAASHVLPQAPVAAEVSHMALRAGALQEIGKDFKYLKWHHLPY